MSKTVTKLIGAALQQIGVKDPGEELESIDLATGIERLNEMMARWEADGVSLGWADVTSGATTVPVPEEALMTVQASLAVVLAPEYGREAPATIVALSSQGYAALHRDSIAHAIRPTRMDFLPSGDGQSGYDIESDL